MKAFVAVALFVACFVFAQGGLTDEQKAKILEYSTACKAESGVDPELVVKAKNGEFTNDPKLRAYGFCMGKKIGIFNDQGEFQKDVLLAKLPEGTDKVKAEQAIEECRAQSGATPEETTYLKYKCFYEKAHKVLVQ